MHHIELHCVDSINDNNVHKAICLPQQIHPVDGIRQWLEFGPVQIGWNLALRVYISARSSLKWGSFLKLIVYSKSSYPIE